MMFDKCHPSEAFLAPLPAYCALLDPHFWGVVAIVVVLTVAALFYLFRG